MNEPTTFGAQVRAARKAKGLSQNKLAAIIGVTQQTIHAWEAGVSTPRPDRRAKLEQVLLMEFMPDKITVPNDPPVQPWRWIDRAWDAAFGAGLLAVIVSIALAVK